MNNLIIDFIKLDNEDNESQILINGKNLCTRSYCNTKYKYLSVYDKELFEELKKYKICDILGFFEKINISIENIDSIDIDIKLNPPYYDFESNEKKLRILAQLRYEPEDWNKPWSLKEHANLFFEKVKLIDKAEKYHEIVDQDEESGENIYTLMNGFGLAIDIEDSSITLASAYKEVFDLCHSLDTEVEREFLSLVNEGTIERYIEFPPEYHQAGLGILNYFGTYLREQYPEENATVKIEQQGLKVRMIIETEDGQLKIVEKALHEYELIITGKELPEKFTNSDKLILELKNELRIAKLRLELNQDVMLIQKNQIDKFFNIVGDGLSKNSQVTIDFKPEINLSNTVIINQNIASVLGNINELIEKFPTSESELQSLNELKNSLEQIEVENDPSLVRKSSAMSKFKRFVNNAMENGSKLNEIIKSIDSGWDILSELAENYNKIAQWCGLPSVPPILIKNSEDRI
jgi:hypothetical protein